MIIIPIWQGRFLLLLSFLQSVLYLGLSLTEGKAKIITKRKALPIEGKKKKETERSESFL